MSPRRKANVPIGLMTVRMIHEEHGLPLVTAQSFVRAGVREGDLVPVRIPGFRRVFFKRDDVERWLQASGGMRCV